MSTAEFTGAGWHKSSYSGGNGSCVEVAVGGGFVGVRDSKDPASPVLAFTATDFGRFVAGVRDGALRTPGA
ncbi:DUF397 domain-containing protein [Micromonospora sp. NBC_01813]|uniref:DUF397 domain-containing protein n=1 Tax=Micromonospora sp. NBC_01813 TaxID=2975988 RepID=UPI002DD831DE|nr:DUF397 domain-containing protein [Micromonospora sp. NBC_01813]WSA08438.1 DUF397 domain-containing protein [Micromonospora sp. NBC_01813]